MSASTAPLADPRMLHRRAGAGDVYVGPGDLYRFLVTGAETGGAYFPMEAFVPLGGGPPLHIHTREDETFYVLEGTCEFRLGDELVTAGPGDFVSVPRGEVQNFPQHQRLLHAAHPHLHARGHRALLHRDARACPRPGRPRARQRRGGRRPLRRGRPTPRPDVV
jgi:mannose-6-phosphate isomerase-like protein (cupin superfamily)